jgi:hypothetical protein
MIVKIAVGCTAATDPAARCGGAFALRTPGAQQNGWYRTVSLTLC